MNKQRPCEGANYTKNSLSHLAITIIICSLQSNWMDYIVLHTNWFGHLFALELVKLLLNL